MRTRGWMLVASLFLAGCGALPTNALSLDDSEAGLPVHARDAQTPDLGIENFVKVNDTLYRGGLPSDEQLKALVKLGVKTDVCLMNGLLGNEAAAVAHEKAACARLGLRWVNLPVPYGVEPPASMVDRFLSTAETPSSGPLYVHCKHGRDRTGVMVAAFRIHHDGYTGDQALQEMQTYGYDPARYPYFTRFVLDDGRRNGLQAAR